MDVQALLETLRRSGSDTASIEVKNGRGGFPESVLESLSALANLPGGGVLVIGLDEAADFHAVPISDPKAYMQALGSKARELKPPARLDIELADVDGRAVIVAAVAECDPSAKPCRLKSSGKAYVRSHDGDYSISAEEEQGFLRLRSSPSADRVEVPGTTAEDLDVELVARWRDTVRLRDPDGLGRFDDDEMLVRAGAITRARIATKAGLLALGVYPQQHFPRLAVHAADLRGASRNERARSITTFAGPVPIMLADTLAWLAKNLNPRAVQGPDGALRDMPEYPLPALRELVANALVHRDLDSWSQGRSVELRLKTGRLELTNPGGLYGVTVDRLGTVAVTSARNQWLLSLCENVTDHSGSRVVEALASGLTKVSAELRAAGLPPAEFFDTGITFTVALTSTPAHPAATSPAAGRILPEPGTHMRQVYDALVSEPAQSVRDLAEKTRLSPTVVRTALVGLRSSKWDLVRVDGGPGRQAKYSPGAS